MKVTVVINQGAGAMRADGEDHMRRALRASGLADADIVMLDTGDFESRIRAVVDTSPDLLIVWGGDGTHRSALSAVGLNGPNLLLLPGGTMNLLSKSLHGDKPWEQILQKVIADSTTHILPAGMIDGHLFYCAMLAGAPVGLAEARERIRHGNLAKGMSQFTAAISSLGTMHLVARYSDGYHFKDAHLPTTSVIGALVGPMSQNGRMEVFALAHPSAISALNIAWSSLRSSWRRAEGIAIVAAETLVIDSEEGKRIRVIIDGEEIIIGRQARVTYVPEAAQCLTLK